MDTECVYCQRETLADGGRHDRRPNGHRVTGRDRDVIGQVRLQLYIIYSWVLDKLLLHLIVWYTILL